MNHSSILLLGSIALDTIETSYGRGEDLLGGSATYAAISAYIYIYLVKNITKTMRLPKNNQKSG